MKRKAAWIFLGLILGCLGANGQESEWEASIGAGKADLEQHRYAEAERAFQEALTAANRFGEKDARFSSTLLFLAQTSDAQSKQEEAETFAKRAADSMEKSLKAYKPTKAEDQFTESAVAAALFDKVGDIFAAHWKNSDAEGFYQRVIKIRAEAAEDHPHPQNNEDYFRFLIQFTENTSAALATAEEKLGSLYFTEHKYDDAAAMYTKSIKIRESKDQTDKRFLAQSLSNLATCFAAQGKYDQAEPLYQRALAIFEEANWKEKPEALRTMQVYALLLKKVGREEEAKAMLDRVRNVGRQAAPAAK